MSLGVHRPTRHLFAEDSVQEATQATEDEGQQVELRKPLGCRISRMDVVLVHSGDAEQAESRIVELEAKLEPEDRLRDRECGTVEEQEGGHRAPVVPVRGI